VKDKTVYILGAGCSVNYGYPLAKDFLAGLKGYLDTLSQRPNCERLKQCVTNTVNLMEKYRSPTVDRLVLQIVEEIERQRQPLGFIVTKKHNELDGLESRHILEAKVATTALFLEIEAKARRTGLQGYRDFLNIIFEGNRDQNALKLTNICVLSFNYERLFEIAFVDFFRLDANTDCHSETWLNSSLNFLHRQEASVDLNRFCFLKLHGTAGIWAARQHGKSKYGLYANRTAKLLSKIEQKKGLKPFVKN
jgi:hypothetical protein